MHKDQYGYDEGTKVGMIPAQTNAIEMQDDYANQDVSVRNQNHPA
jgi:hypothetical protein